MGGSSAGDKFPVLENAGFQTQVQIFLATLPRRAFIQKSRGPSEHLN